ncbi:MAG TPA: hypothetical protein VH230_07315 [Stellaceae bacterium]|nr:hypothetical protein [Stellaceae bacterium]
MRTSMPVTQQLISDALVSAFRMSIEPCGSCATTTCSQIAAAVIGLLDRRRI